MKFHIKCIVCGATCRANGEDDPDTNSCSIDDYDPPCEHLADGGDFEVIDSEYPDLYPEYD